MSGMLFRVALKLDISRVHLHFKYRVCTSRIQYSLVGNYLGGNYFGEWTFSGPSLPSPLSHREHPIPPPHRAGCAGICPRVPAQEDGYRGAAFPRQAQFPSSIEHFMV